ncbi:fungal trichothecene efflux pump-domain-containing protein [Exophiala viscosa]|uniref:fungal trichothecene efflux pump-domain-containing protein n=1 Tax=Exophiala viscosa TaxID=2486360 RepID=UPI00219C58BB|nr:fungal trichothecene efflux pump-domain-containing protein [Exophiala viscosa]
MAHSAIPLPQSEKTDPVDVERIDVVRDDSLPVGHPSTHVHHDTRVADDEPAAAENTTLRTWAAIFILSSSVGISFWPVPTTCTHSSPLLPRPYSQDTSTHHLLISSVAPMLATLGAQFGNPGSSAWFLSSFTTGCALGFLLSGTTSDLFGRRIIILIGNVLSALGSILCATSHGYRQFTAGMAILGFASGPSQLGLIGVPELLPNKYRHIGIVLSDAVLYPILICAPIIGRYAIKDPTSRDWTYIYYASFIAMVLTFAGVFFLYKPPKHPRGVPWRAAFAGLDYVGGLLVTSGVLLTLMGIVYTTYLPAKSALVLGPLCTGIFLLIVFGIWENLSSVPYKLCPPAIFSYHYGRAFTVPFMFGAVITMYYYAANIIWPTMISVFYTTASSSINDALVLTLPSNLALVAGAITFACLGHRIGYWKITLIISFGLAVIFGGLMALVTPHNKGLMTALIFLMQCLVFFGWAQYEAVAFVQFGVDQLDLGASGGLAGVARFGGGSLAVAVYTSVLTNSQSKKALDIVVKAGMKNGLTEAAAVQLLSALSLGAEAISKVPGINPSAIAAAGIAFQESYAYGCKMLALASLGFGAFGLCLCFLCEDIGPKMNNKTNVFLENDVNATKNEFH